MGAANGNRLRHRTGDVNEFGDTRGMLSSGGAGPGVMTSDQWFAGKHQQAENQKIWNQGIQHDKIDNQAIREANARGLTQGQLETALFGKPQSNQSSAAVPTNWEALLRGIAGVAPQSSSYGDFVGPRQLEGPVQPLSPLSVTYWKEHDPLKRGFEDTKAGQWWGSNSEWAGPVGKALITGLMMGPQAGLYSIGKAGWNALMDNAKDKYSNNAAVKIGSSLPTLLSLYTGLGGVTAAANAAGR